MAVNPGFLGDKVAHGAVLQHLSRKGAQLFGVEPADDALSFCDLAPRDLIGAFTLSRCQYQRPEFLQSLLRTAQSAGVIGQGLAFTTCHTETNCPPAFAALVAEGCQVEALWPHLESLSASRIWPTLPIAPEAETRVTERLGTLGLKPHGYFILHTRELTRDPQRNLDHEKYFAIAAQLSAATGLKGIWIGDDPKPPERRDLVVLSGKSLPIAELSALLASAVAFIGGDSGPLHLAAAAGTVAVSVERTDGKINEGFGPFCDPRRAFKLDPAHSNFDTILAAVRSAERRPSVDRRQPCEREPFRRLPSDAERPGFFSSIGGGSSSSRIIEDYRRLLAADAPDAEYLPFRCAQLAPAANLLAALGVMGFSVGAPFKVQAKALAARCDAVATATGAVNTLVRRSGEWIGHNTDVAGFQTCLEDLGLLPGLRGGRALILGSGGAARAAALVLRDAEVRTAAWSRNPSTLAALRAHLGVEIRAAGALDAAPFDLVVNATGAEIGLGPLGAVVRALGWKQSSTYVDLSVGPTATRNVDIMKGQSIAAHDGWSMLEAQAKVQVRLFQTAQPTDLAKQHPFAATPHRLA